jgi:Spy/CpxP family protein refolding chaperone
MSDEVTVMKRMLLFAVLVMVAGVAVAQNTQRPPSPDVPFMGDWNPPAALTSDWWNDPEIANELHLTDAQKKQLEQVSTNMKLTLIDAGATGLKSYVKLQMLLDADQFDRNAYNQELDGAASAATRLVKDIGQMALTVRTTLSAEQWHKLESMKTRMHRGSHMEMRRSEPPSSLRTPPPR